MQVTRLFATSWSAERIAAAAALAATLCTAAHAATIEPDLAARLAHDQVSKRFPVILRLEKQADAAAIAKSVAALPQAQRGGRLLQALRDFNKPLQVPLLQDLAARKAEGVVPLDTVNAIGAQLGAKDIQELAQRGDLHSIRYDIGLLAPSRRVLPDPCHPQRPTPRQRLPKSCFKENRDRAPVAGVAFDPKLPASDTLKQVGAPQAWQAGFTGKGVTVAIVDTGVDGTQPDLGGRFRGGKADWFDVHGQHTQPVDRHGHGTQIAGLVVAAGATGQTLGVAPEAKWIAARLYNDSNVGRLSDIHRVMAWLLDPDGNPATGDAPQIVLNAWGLGDRPGTCDDEFAADMHWLRAAGMSVVFAAGNGGPVENSSLSPANNKGVLAVGALDSQGDVAVFSSRGVSACDARPYPDLHAPGELVRTTDHAIPNVATTAYGTGTSFAAAVVAGELALLTQARPKLSAVEREALLQGGKDDTRPALVRALASNGGAGQP